MNIITQVILPVGLAFIMFSMGITLTGFDFKQIFKFPRAFLMGACLQIFSLPLLAFILAYLWTIYFALDPYFAVGIMILAACPGGVTSNLMVHLSKGDTALSISLTAVISMLSMLTVPFIVNGALFYFLNDQNPPQLPLFKTAIGIFVITTVPVIIGMWVKKNKPELALKIEPNVSKIATTIFIIIAVAAMLKDFKLVVKHFAQLGGLAIALNVLTMLVAYQVARWVKLSFEQAIAIVFECGLQNSTLAIFVSLTLLKSEAMMIPGVVYSVFMILSVFVLMGYLHKNRSKYS